MTPRTVPIRFSLAVALISAVLLVAPVSAANTRDVYFGSPPANLATCNPTTTGYCPLDGFTAVTTGGATAFSVVLANLGGQTLNHVLVQGGALADQNAGSNTLFPAPSGTSLPAGASFAAVYPSGICSISTVTTPNDSLSCAIGRMRAYSSLSFTIVINVPNAASTAAGYPLWLMVGLNEGSSNTGSNQDTFYATGSVTVAPATCNFVATYSQHVNLSSNIGGCTQAAALSSSSTFSNGAIVQVGLDPSNSWCPGGIKSCQAGLSTANVNNGATLPSYLLWDIVWDPSLLTGNPRGVIHFLDGYDPVTNPGAYVVIYFTGKYACKTSTSTNCWVSAGYNSSGSYEAVVRTPSNGGTKLF